MVSRLAPVSEFFDSRKLGRLTRVPKRQGWTSQPEPGDSASSDHRLGSVARGARGASSGPTMRPCVNALLYQHHYLGERWLARRGTAPRPSPVVQQLAHAEPAPPLRSVTRQPAGLPTRAGPPSEPQIEFA